MKRSIAEIEYCKKALTEINSNIPGEYALEIQRRLAEKGKQYTLTLIRNVRRGLSANKEIVDELFELAKENKFFTPEELKHDAKKRAAKKFKVIK